MEVFSIVINGIISGLSKPVAARISNFWNLDERVHTLRAEIKKLKDTRDDLKRCVDQAELNGLTARNQVKWWLEEVQAIEDEVSVMEERFRQQQQRRCVGCCHANCSSRYKLSTKVAKKLRGVGELVDRGTFCRDPSPWETRGTRLMVTRGTYCQPDHHHPDSPTDTYGATILSGTPQGKTNNVSASPIQGRANDAGRT